MADDFTIASWPVDTTLQLCRVPWDVAYKDVVQFPTRAARDEYFSTLSSTSVTLEKMTYCKMGDPIRINTPFADCYDYNYCVVTNPQLPVDSKTPPVLYYFVTGVAFQSPNTSVLTVALDVWQTYQFAGEARGFEVGYSFLERGHQPMKLSAEQVEWVSGTEVAQYPKIPIDSKRRYMLCPENLESGNDYIIGEREYHDIAYSDSYGDAPWSLPWSVIIMSSTSLEAAWGSVDNPKLKTANGMESDGLVGGCSTYAISGTNMITLMAALSDHPWVSSGIISITAFPTAFINFGPKVKLNNGNLVLECYKVKTTKSGYRWLDSNISIDEGISHVLQSYGGNCQYFYKLHTYPFSMIQLSNRNGQVLDIKPESIYATSLTLRAYCCGVPGNIRIGMAVSKFADNGLSEEPYKSGTLTSTSAVDKTLYAGYNLDSALWFDNFPQLSIVNDGYISYLAGTTHSREYAYDSASWGYQKGSMAVGNMLAQTNLQLQTNAANRQVANNTAMIGVGLNAMQSVASGIASGGVLGGIAGAAGGALGAVGTYNQVHGANLQFANNQAQLNQSAGMNADYQNAANKGDYHNAIAGINAKVQDMALTQPSISGANGGNGFALSNCAMGVDIRWMIPQKEFVIAICKYWGRYGYAYNQYINVGTEFNLGNAYTYWKMQDVYLTTAQADEGSKDVIRAIFEKGVTVWVDPTKIGKVSPLDNYFK